MDDTVAAHIKFVHGNNVFGIIVFHTLVYFPFAFLFIISDMSSDIRVRQHTDSYFVHSILNTAARRQRIRSKAIHFSIQAA